MASVLFNYPKFKAANSNGTPLVGGKLYSYTAGTTTSKTTWSDAGLSSANANPIILDSNGEATIYLGSGTYKFVLKTANDTVLWTEDDISSTSTDAYKYYPDQSETDQGVASSGGSATLKDFVDDIGATKNATIVLSHSEVSTSNTTEYTVTTNLIITSNIHIEVQSGAQITGAGTLTINSPEHVIASPKQQIVKTGQSTLAFTNPGLAYPFWWNEDVADGTTDAYTAIDACATALAADSTIYFPTGTYLLKTSLTLADKAIVESDAIFKDDASNAALTINNDFDASPNIQCFDWGTGTGDLTFGLGSVREITPNMWGFATGGSAADNAAAFNECLTTAFDSGVDIRVLPGVYTCDPIAYSKTSGTTLSGITIRGPKCNDEIGSSTSYLDFSGLTGAEKGIEFNDTGTGGQIVGMTIQDLGLYGPGIANNTVGMHVHSSATGNGIRWFNLKNVSIERFNTGLKVEGDGAGAGYDNWPFHTSDCSLKDNGVNLFLGSGNTVGQHDCLQVNNSSLGTVGIYMQAPTVCQTFNSPVIQQTTYGIVLDTLEADASPGQIRGITFNSPYLEGVEHGLNVGYKVDGATASGFGSAKQIVWNGGQNQDPTGAFCRNSLSTSWLNNVFNAAPIDAVGDFTVGNPANTTVTSSLLSDGGNIFYFNNDGTACAPITSTGVSLVTHMYKIFIQDGGAANSVKLTCSSVNNLNGEDIAAEDDLVKTSVGARYSVSANGSEIKILEAATAGTAVGVFSSVMQNSSGTDVNVTHEADGTDIVLAFTNSTSGAAVDLTTLVDTGDIITGLMVIADD